VASPTPELTWAGVRAALGSLARERSEWAGIPLPIEGRRMVIHPSYAFAESLGEVFIPKDQEFVCRNSDISEEVALQNEWRSYRDGRMVRIWRDGKRFFRTFGTIQNAGPLLIPTLEACKVWDLEAEIRAMETLRRHITPWAWETYFMTGMFLESSKRSRVFYIFRRLRPTIALTGNPDKRGRDVGLRILCCLCAHPIGYYEGSWAGAMVPTDDVIAHLLMMRADEHYFWRVCNQHPPWAPESGL